MDREKIAKELDAISCTLHQLSGRLERLANEIYPQKRVQPATLADIPDDMPITFGR